jgi:NDP-sugar pyrophosphorylase family protein
MGKKTLLILAAGMGSRYGGLKQLDEVGPSGETIIEYSVYDAIQAGFNKIVFIIRDEFKEDIKSKIGSKFEDQVEILYVNQSVNTQIDDVIIQSKRVKPWGTGHAVLVAAPFIQEPFAVINADDFYGRDGFMKMASFLEKECNKENHGLIGYILSNTLSDNGYVSRGVCTVDESGFLSSINERTKIHAKSGKVFYEDHNIEYEVDAESVVSMNFWGFHPSIFSVLREGFLQFAQLESSESSGEYFIPLAVDYCIKNNIAHFKTIISNDKWFGVTYKEDKNDVQLALSKMTAEGKYPVTLFKK